MPDRMGHNHREAAAHLFRPARVARVILPATPYLFTDTSDHEGRCHGRAEERWIGHRDGRAEEAAAAATPLLEGPEQDIEQNRYEFAQDAQAAVGDDVAVEQERNRDQG